jgi:acetyl esterase
MKLQKPDQRPLTGKKSILKRVFLFVAGSILALILILGIIVYSWTFTEHGRLDPEVAVALKLMPDLPDPNTVSPSEAVKLLRKPGRTSRTKATELFHVEDRKIPGPLGEIPIRVYQPIDSGGLPILIWYHGGGFTMGDLDGSDDFCRKMSILSGAIVISVDYRLAPEYTFPAAAEDAYTALAWVAKNAELISGDSRRIAVMGGSAGGCLAAVTTLMAKDRKGPSIIYQVLYFPSTDQSDSDFPSHTLYAKGYYLTYEWLKFFRRQYIPNESDRKHPYASPLLAPDHSGLPPALIITAEFDPVRDEGETYAQKLKEAGVSVRLERYTGVVHGFVGVPFIRKANVAIEESVKALKDAFNKSTSIEKEMR